MNQLLEEVVETQLYNYFTQTGKNISWAAGNIRAIQKQLKEQGTIKENLIKEDGEIEMMDILESMGILAQASFIHRIDSLKLPEFLKDFIKWCRSIISQAAHLADLGKAIHSLDKAGKLDKTFAQAIYEAADITQEFWKNAAIDSTHLELARIASAAVAPYQTNLSSSQDISNGAYQAWLNTTTIEDTDQDNATPPYEKTEENTQAPTLNASFSVTAHDQHGNTLHPKTFITKKDGNIDWLHLKKGKTWKPIRLCVGEDKWTHKGYGLTHIVASRSLDNISLWDHQSPEQYILETLSNASELYEMGGREVLVKGKKPSQWLLIQLMEEGGFYSVITAYPVSNNKKPVGKRVQLRSATSTLDVDQAGFDEHNAYKTTSQSLNTTSNSESNLPNGLPPVNIKDVTCTFDDGSTLQASFSIASSDNVQWNKQLDDYFTGKHADPKQPLHMGSMPDVLSALGYKKRDLVIFPHVIDKISGGKHELSEKDVRGLASAIYDPILIINSATQADSLVVLTDIKTDGGDVIVAIHVDKNTMTGTYHVVASAYPKKSGLMVMEQIKNGNLRYINKKRALAWARSARLQLPSVASQKGKAIVLTPEDVVKYKNAQNKKSFPLSDFLQGDQTDSTSFSVVGPKAKNWSQLKDRSFLGRDDGLPRAELDSSQSKIQPDFLTRVQKRINKDNSEKKVRFTLANVLDYPELYQAYPQLAKKAILLSSLGTRGITAWYNKKTHKIVINTLNFTPEHYDSNALRSTLLHELQHAIQHIEGYASGSSSKDQDEYTRAAGEIEARNVQTRSNMSQEQRDATAFNDSLEYEGSALVNINNAKIEIPFNLVTGEFSKNWESLKRTKNTAHTNFINLIVNALNKDAERLTRYSELTEDERADMAITLMRATNIAKTAVMYMPKGYRIGLKPYLDWLEVFTDVAHNGTLDWAASAPAPYWSQLMIGHLEKTANQYTMEGYNQEQTLELMKDYGETRIYMLLSKLLNRVSKNLEEYGKTKLHDQITELLHSTKPTLNKNGQYNTGTLSVESRRELERLTQLGIHSTTETLDALKNNLITEDDAYRTATAFPSNTEAQRSATAALIDGSSWSEAYNTATAKLAIQALAASNANNGYQQDIDLFGNTDTEALYRHIGHFATKRQAELGKEITAINGAAKNPSIAQKYGIDVQNPESTRQAIAKLQEIRSQWKNFALHPELLQEANNYAKTKLSKTNAKESIAASRQIDETLLNNINTQTTFSITPQDNSQWNKQLDDYFSSKKINPLNHLTIGGTPAILTALGYEKRNIVISPGTLNKIMVDKHNLTENEVRDLARAIYDPILIIDSASESDALIVLTDIKNERGSIIAAIHIDKNTKQGIKHVMASAYPKATGGMISSQIKHGDLLYIDKKRALAWARSVGLQLPKVASQKGKPIVLTPEDIVKQKNTHDKNSTTFSIIGSNATNFLEYKDQGLSYLDPADHKEKAIISTEGISLRKQKLTVPQGSVTHTSLAALLHHPELYRSYPDIAKYRVSIYNDPEENASGFMSKDSAYIAINTAYGDSTSQLSTLLHEIQHAIQLHEGFATGSAVTTKKEAIAYIKHSIQQLNNRTDEWAKHQLPFLRTLHNQVQKNKIDPQSIYLASHGEQEARLAGKLTTKTKGGKNGYKLLGIGGNLTIPITGEWKDLGAITFTKSPYSTLLAEKLAPQGDWIYDTLIFKIRASLDRTAKRLSNYTSNQQDTNNEGLELYAQAIELITSVEKHLPKSYGMALEPYKIWINTFATLAGNGNISQAANTLPMKHWDDIMSKSFTKAYHNYIANNPSILIAQETLKAQDPENADAILFHTYGQNFLKQYGKEKIDKLIAKFLDRTIEHIDQYRKDKTLGKIRRITSTLTPKHDKNGKPLKGKITADQYRKLESYIRLIELTESEYNNYFEKHYNDNTPEEQRYENLPPEHPITLTLEDDDDDGTSKQHIYTKQEIETYACWTLMNVNTAEKAAAALGEYISTSRNAWENAQLNKKAQTETLLQDLLTSTGDITETQIAQARNKSKLTPLPKETLSILDVFMNLGQYADILSKHPELKTIANNLKQRAAKASTNIEYAELQRLQAQQQIIANITGITDRYQQSDWLYEHKRTRDSGITITTQEPDYQAKANAEYQDRLLKLLRRKAKTHGLEALQPYLQALDLSPTTQAIIHARYTHPSIKPTKKQITKALEHQDRVFTPSEWNTYASQTKFIKEKAAQLKEKAKENTPSTQTLNAISRDAAAYIILLCEQKSYTEMMRQKGYTEEIIEKLHTFVGTEGMKYAYALRELLNTRSKEIQQLIEKRYGTPFPLEDNYYRAYFDASPELTNKSIADGSSYGDAANAGTYGSIHTRRKHNAPIDLSIGATNTFLDAVNTSEHWLTQFNKPQKTNIKITLKIKTTLNISKNKEDSHGGISHKRA